MYTVFLAGKSLNIRSYTRCIYTVLANPKHVHCSSCDNLNLCSPNNPPRHNPMHRCQYQSLRNARQLTLPTNGSHSFPTNAPTPRHEPRGPHAGGRPVRRWSRPSGWHGEVCCLLCYFWRANTAGGTGKCVVCCGFFGVQIQQPQGESSSVGSNAQLFVRSQLQLVWSLVTTSYCG